MATRWRRCSPGDAAKQCRAFGGWAEAGPIAGWCSWTSWVCHRIPKTITRRWGEACRGAGVRPIRLHDTRHTAATLALRAGVPVKVVAQRLGHCDPALTMRVYQHVSVETTVLRWRRCDGHWEVS